MSFETELLNKQFKLNTVIKVGSVYYSDVQVDSDATDIIGTGLGVTAARVGTVKNFTTNPISIDMRDIKTTVATTSFNLTDLASVVTADISASTTSQLDEEVLVYVGFITGTFDFADYELISRTRVKSIRRSANSYSYTTTEVTGLLAKEIFNTQSLLNGAISSGATTLVLDDATDFPAAGMLKIEDEVLVYTGKSVNTLTGLSRGDQSTVAAAHPDDAVVYLVTDTGDINPITLMLQMIISPGGGGPYDVLDDGLGISQSLVDVTGFEDIRTDFFASDQFRFYLYNIGNGLKFLESEILLATNTRFFPKNGQISLGILDQLTIGSFVDTFDEDTIIGQPSWNIGSDKIVNKVIVNFDYNEGLQGFARHVTVMDDDSITDFGEKKTLEFNFKGVRASLSGSSIALNRANRILLRLSNPLAAISIQTQFDKVLVNIAENVEVVHRYLPAQGGGLGISDQLEVISKSVNYDTATVQWDLQYTSFTGLRVGLIAPSHTIASVVSQSVFTVSDSSAYAVGYFLKLWDELNSVYFADAANEIIDITGNQITVSSAWATTLVVGDVRVKFADYSESSATQRAKYAYVVANTNVFPDSVQGYQIIP